MRNTTFWMTALGLAMGTALCLAAQGQSAGQLLDVTGRVEVLRGRQPPMKGMLLFPLQAGDLLQVRSGGSAVVVLFQTGARFALSSGSSVKVKLNSLAARSGPAPKPLKPLPLPHPPAKSSSERILGLVVRSPVEALVGPRQPWPDGAVRDVPVTLHWSGPVEGTGLELRVRSDRKTLLRELLPATAHEFTLPAGLLQRGEYYLWSVTTIPSGRGGGKHCSALLRVLLPEERAALEALERETAQERQSDRGSPAPLLLLAQGYRNLGMLKEAAREYQAALQLRPADPGIQAALKALEHP